MYVISLNHPLRGRNYLGTAFELQLVRRGIPPKALKRRTPMSAFIVSEGCIDDVVDLLLDSAGPALAHLCDKDAVGRLREAA